MSPSTPTRILVSTTIKELVEFRRSAIEAVERCGYDTLSAEQEKTSSTNAVLDALSLVDKADVFIGIFGHRYGYVPRAHNPDALSLSELQYRRALERGIPVHIFLTSESMPMAKSGTLEPLSETTQLYRQKIRTLRQDMALHHPIVFFDSPESLFFAVRETLIAANYALDAHPAPEAPPPPPPEEDPGPDVVTEMIAANETPLKLSTSELHVESPVELHGESEFTSDAFAPTPTTAWLAESQPAPEPESIELMGEEVPPAPQEIQPDGPPVVVEPPLTLPPELAPAIGAIPRRPAPYIAHTFPEPAQLFGRNADMELLRSWLYAPESVLVLDGSAGVGKSSLAWYWLHLSAAETPNIAAWTGIIWWSFAESDSSFRNFVRRALSYLAGQPLDVVDQLPPPVREQALLKALRDRPILIILDDVERMLGHWFRHEGPFLSEPQVEQALNADRELLKCADPAQGLFLRKLTAVSPSKVMLISRAVPEDLYEGERKLMPGVVRLQLGGLHPNDGLVLLQERGIRGDEAAMKTLIEQIDGHPLLLNLLAGQIGHTFPVRGDYETWYRGGGYRLGLNDLSPAARRTAVLNYILSTLPPPLSLTLLQLSAFRNGVDIAAVIGALPFVPPRPQKMTEPRRWQADYARAKAHWDEYRQAMKDYEADRRAARPRLDAALSELIERGLVLKDRYIQRYTVHPAVRGAVLGRINETERFAAFLRIRDFAETLPPEVPDRAKDISNLAGSMELYRALVSAGQLDQAAAVYRTRIAKAPLAQITSHYQVIEMLRVFFPSGLGTMPALSSLSDRGYFANEMALALGSIGQRTEAMRQLGQAFGPFAQGRSARHLCAALLNYAGLMRDDYQLAAKAHVFELARELADAANELESLSTARLFLLKIYADTGQFDLAATLYDEFMANLPRLRTAYRRATAERMVAKMRVYQQQDPTAALNLALQLALESGSPHEQLAVYALWGETGLQQDRPDAAEKFFSEALNMAIKTGVPTDNYAGGLARALARQDRLDEARALLLKGVSRAAAAEVYLALGDHERAKQYALDAYRAAWADGPPFSYWMELENAKRVLNALDILPPLLPFYETSSMKPLPYEDEIRAFIEELWDKNAAGPGGR